MSALIASDVDAEFYRPCVGVMLVNTEGRIWVGERYDFPGAWQMPQGGVDVDEGPREAALRELAEETSVSNVSFLAEAPDWLKYDFPPDLAGRAWKGRWRGQMQKWFAFRHLGTDSDIDVSGVELPEFGCWRWVDLDEVPRLIVEFKRPLYEVLVETFRPHIA